MLPPTELPHSNKTAPAMLKGSHHNLTHTPTPHAVGAPAPLVVFL